MFVQLALLFLLFYSNSTENVVHFRPTHAPQALVLCLEKYFQNFFNSNPDTLRSLLLLRRPVIETELEEYFYSIVSESSEWKSVLWNIDCLETDVAEELSQNLNSVIFLTTQDLSDHDFIKRILDLNTFMHVILTDTEELDTFEFDRAINSVFHYFQSNINVIALRKNENANAHEKSLIWKMLKFKRQNCSWSNFEAVTFEECFTSGTNVYFEDKTITNVTSKECPIYVSGINNIPYAYYDKAIGFYKGIDYNLVKFIANRLNKDLEFYYMNDSEFSEFSKALLVPTDSRRVPILRKADLYFGGLSDDLNIQRYFSSTIGYYSDDITWCISRAKPIPLWLNMWQVGDKMSWCLAFLAGYLNGFILYFMFQFDQNPYWIRKDLHYTIICIALPAFIGNSQMYRPRNTMVMIFIGLMLIEGIIVSALWNGFLIRVISHPIQGMQTQAIAEIIADDFRLVGTSFAMHKIQQQHNYPDEKKAMFCMCINIDHCLKQLILDQNDDLAVATLRHHAINIPDIPREKLYCFDKTENIISLTISMWVRKDFPLLTRLNKIIRYSFEAGLIQKWESETRIVNKFQKNEVHTVILTMEHTASAMMVLGIGTVLGLLSIYAEPIVHRKAREQNSSWFWLFADHFFDGDRCYFLNPLGGASPMPSVHTIRKTEHDELSIEEPQNVKHISE